MLVSPPRAGLASTGPGAAIGYFYARSVAATAAFAAVFLALPLVFVGINLAQLAQNRDSGLINSMP
jgi:hypothetical protein